MKERLKKLTGLIAAFAITVMCLPCMPVTSVEAATPSSYTGDNLLSLYDPDFEGSSVVSGWNTTGTYTTEQKFSGNQSLKVTTTATSTSNTSMLKRSFTFHANKKYYVSAHVRPSSDNLYFFRGVSQWRWCYANKWNQIRAVISFDKDTTQNIEVMQISGAAAGTVYIDNLQVFEVGENLLEAYDPDFENTDAVTGSNGNDSYSNYWNVRGGTTSYDTSVKFSGARSVKLSARPGDNVMCGPVAQNIKVQKGKRYYVSAWVYSPGPEIMRVRFASLTNGYTGLDINAQKFENIPSKRWTNVGYFIDCTADASDVMMYVQSTYKESDLYVDNFEIYDVTTPVQETVYTGENLIKSFDPDFEGSSVVSGWNTTGVLTSEQKYSGNQSLKVTTEYNEANNSLLKRSFTFKANKKYYISVYVRPSSDGLYFLRGLPQWRQCYKDTWNHMRGVISFDKDTTQNIEVLQLAKAPAGAVYVDKLEIVEFGSNLLAKYDPDFETSNDVVGSNGKDSYSYYWNVRGGTASYSTADKMFTSGARAIKVTRAGDNVMCGPVAQNVKVQKGKKYYVSAWVRSSVEDKFRVRFSSLTSGWTGLDSDAQTFEKMPKDRWTNVGYFIDCTADGSDLQFYVQSSANKSGEVYVDNFELYDVTPPPAVVYSPQNGAEKVAVDTDLKLVFSEEVNGVSASNIQINDATVGEITSSADNKVFTVDLGTLETNKTYNAKVTGVVDKNGKNVEDKTFTFKTASIAGYKNLMADYDPGFEAGEPDSAMWAHNNTANKATIVRTTDKAHSGEYSVVRKNADAGYRGIYAKPALEENTIYYASMWVYSDVADSAQLRIQFADTANIPGKKAIPAGVWTKFDAVITTRGAQDLSQARFSLSTTGNIDVYVDDFELVKIGKELSSDVYDIDNTALKAILYKEYTDKYTAMTDIASDIIGASDFDITVSDTDGSGNWTSGDKFTITSKTLGKDYVKTYTVDVRDYYDSNTEALIVKGSDGIGDDFSHSDTITKSGNAFIEYRVENNNTGTITPAVVAAVYDKDGKLLDFDTDDGKSIGKGQYADFELEAEIPSDAEDAVLKIMVWESVESVKPLMQEKVYAIDTNNFTIPTVISNNMVLQRNANAVIYGSAPEGAVVTAELSGGIKGEYTVPEGDSEFFVKLPMGEYTTEEQTLTITATDKDGENLGSFTRTGILVGDVYYGSGQSNMARQFKHTADAIKAGSSSIYTADKYDEYVAEYKAIGAELSTKNVRFFKSLTEETSISRGSRDESVLAAKEVWRTIGEDNIDDTYNVMVRMVAKIKSLDEYKDVPIGIVACAQGGTIAAKWVSRDTLFNAGFDQKELDEYEANITRTDSQWYWASHTDLYYDGARAVLPYTFKAAVWYQGQSDTSLNYDRYLAGVIHDIRESQKNDELPVLVLGLFGVASSDYTSCWSVQRLCQLNAASQLDNVYTTITNDTGDVSGADTYHPANDITVAHRAARNMLANVYGDDVAWKGPEYASAVYGTGSATITVNTNGGTLAKYSSTVGSPMFELTTDGGATWTAANSITVDGNTVVVSNSKITGDVNGVRYAMTPVTVKCIYGTYTDALGTDVEMPLMPFDTTYVPNTITYK